LHGIVLGVGNILAGIFCGLLGHFTSKSKRNPILALGLCIHLVTFGAVFVNLPDSSPFGETQDEAILAQSSVVLAVLCSFALGFASACLNTQVTRYLQK